MHENIAAHDMAGSLAEASPELAQDIIFGAEALLFLESRWAGELLAAWEAGGKLAARAGARGDHRPAA